jgi:hypothetical protein
VTSPFRTAGLQRTLAVALVLTIAASETAQAQSAFKTNRKWIYSVAGAIAVGGLAYAFTADHGFNSACSQKTCVLIMAGAIGAGVGYLVGAELDKAYARKMVAGPNLEYSFREVPLGLVPDRMAYYPGGAAVVGWSGARIVSLDGTVSSRAGGVRGIEDAAVIPELDLLVVGTFANLITFPVADETAQGQVVDERGAARMEVFRNHLAVAGLDSLRLLEFTAESGSVSVETVAGFENLDFVNDMAISEDGRTAWILIEHRLSSYTSELEKIGEVELPGPGRTVRVRGSRLAIAAGSSGVYVLDATDPAAPRVVLHYTGIRFAYAADLDGDRLYVAAGPEGVAVVDVSGDEPQVIGVARKARFATDVVTTAPGSVWILDRDGRSIQIAEFGVEHPVTGSNPDH